MITDKIIVSFGMPSAGKTTTLKEMRKIDDRYMYYYDDAITKKGSYLNYLINKIFVEAEYSYLYEFQVISMVSRYEKYISAVRPAVVDESIYNTNVYTCALYEIGLLNKHQYSDCIKRYDVLMKNIIKPDVILFVNCELDDLKKRISNRGVVHESFYTKEYLNALYNNTNELIIKLKEDHFVYEINTSIYSQKEAIYQIIKDRII